MSAPDQIKYTILEDGTIKVETDKVSMANHVSAEQLLKEIEKIAGGPVEVKSKHAHASHGHSHSHGQGEGQHQH